MTIVLGVVGAGRVTLGTDAGLFDEKATYTSSLKRIYDFSVDESKSIVNSKLLLIGACGMYALNVELASGRYEPPKHKGEQPDDYLFRLARSLRDYCRGDEWLWDILKHEDDNAIMLGSFVVAWDGCLYEIDSCFGVLPQPRFAAAGDAEPIALGAMEALWHRGMEPEPFLRQVYQIVAKYNTNTRDPFETRSA